MSSPSAKGPRRGRGSTGSHGLTIPSARRPWRASAGRRRSAKPSAATPSRSARCSPTPLYAPRHGGDRVPSRRRARGAGRAAMRRRWSGRARWVPEREGRDPARSRREPRDRRALVQHHGGRASRSMRERPRSGITTARASRAWVPSCPTNGSRADGDPVLCPLCTFPSSAGPVLRRPPIPLEDDWVDELNDGRQDGRKATSGIAGRRAEPLMARPPVSPPRRAHAPRSVARRRERGRRPRRLERASMKCDLRVFSVR